MDQVITVFKSKSLKLHTTRSWDFLGLTVDNAGHTPPPQLAYGSDIVVGIFDTGIWPESESFREPPESKPVPPSWNGKCVGGDAFDPSVHCNRKLIGAQFYLKGFEETYGPINRKRDPEYRSPRDYLGHGTHTASTAVGSVVRNVSGYSGHGRGTARGGARSARLAVYKTCWGKDLEGVCTEADILAAFDDAIRDGVHVISASFGSSPPLSPYFESSADIGAFHAAERGISVVFSCGNGGPDLGVVQNVAPWAVSVAASTVDRSFPTRIVIDGNFTLTGQSLISKEIRGSLAVATSYFDGGVCKWEKWLKKSANEKIILCFSTLGPVQFIEEAQAAAIRANASALIFAASPTKQLVEEEDTIPTVRVDFLRGTRIRNYLARSPTVPMVKIGPSETVIGDITAPSVAYFSSRGPSSLSPHILKPDITAPGVGILAAWPSKTPPTLLPGDHRPVEWNLQSGTSMSCPHVAGVMALLRSAHPKWSPAAIRSAIMTTADTRDTSNDLILSGGSMKSSDPFDIGAGHINPLKAMDPGLIYDTRTEDYVLFLCNIGYTDQEIKSMLLHSESFTTCLMSHSYRTNANFNYPSITIPSLISFGKTVKRTVRNVGTNKNTVYFVDIVRPVGVEVVIWPRILVFSKCQQEHSYYVTFKHTNISSGRYVFGEIIWTDGFHRVRSPLVVFLSPPIYPLVGSNRKHLSLYRPVVFHMDIISQLSDDLLLRILSFVPTKDVVATSLLSKRWRYLWKLVPQLEYDDSNHIGDYKIFSQYVYRSLLANKAPVVEYFHLNLGMDCPVIDISLWIDTAVSRRVRELEIDIRSCQEVCFTLPSSVYTSETLETLTLVSFVLLNVPVNVSLPSLTSLILENVDYADDQTLPRLLSGCPNLEELFVQRHDSDETMDATVVVPSLQRLTMLETHSGTRGRYVIDVPSLKYLSITENVVYNFRQIENMPELEEADLDITHGVTQRFLRALTSVRRLSLSVSLSEVMNPSGMIFNQLVHLELNTYAQGWWDLLTHMLQDSPKLKTLKLISKHISGGSGKNNPNGWKPPSSVPECLLGSLEDFVWNGYQGRQGDRGIATYVIENAACLKTATFFPKSTDVGKKYKMLKELASIAAASTSFQLLFD
ncbi:unnamed protein product [Microthlaspi erraticum]|uniref:F-box domain-containing protein n=1 Tax=Microthlaspi erraticum TaxID=1685480 RepID=A0A6D2IFF6_9BRAS|nr:unnamed protein product [Microthlaspi erraticum]